MRNGPPPTRKIIVVTPPPPKRKDIQITDEIKMVEKPDYLGFLFVMKVFGL